MSIITFISDFGLSDHYVSSVKASILKYNSSNHIIDISHEINKYDSNYYFLLGILFTIWIKIKTSYPIGMTS